MLLYEDEFVYLTDSILSIKHFTFPTKKPKNINVDHIEILWFEDQSTCKSSNLKTWGKSSGSSVFWAFDVKRCMGGDRSNVVVDFGTKTRVGFSVSDCDLFMDAMRTVLDYHCIVVDTINC